ncbi:MAG: hypothetical protein ACI9Y1_002150, partial [Lentisphaeria bacterium]
MVALHPLPAGEGTGRWFGLLRSVRVVGVVPSLMNAGQIVNGIWGLLRMRVFGWFLYSFFWHTRIYIKPSFIGLILVR